MGNMRHSDRPEESKNLETCMQRIATIHFILTFLLTLNQALAYDFESFKVKGALKTINQIESKSTLLIQEKAQEKMHKLINAQREVARKLLNLDEVGNLAIKDDTPDERYSMIFKKIKELIGQDVQKLGDNETAPLIFDHQMGGGVQNFSGLSWHRPQSNFLLHANREISPDLMSDNWIVHDTLIITIDASTLLTNMKDLDLIDINDELIALYAGMGFQRTYHFWHFADSYINGLTSDYRKLFLNFLYFTPEKISSLSPYEIIKRKDQFYLNVGGAVNTPPYYGVSFRGGVIANTSYQNELSIQSLGENDTRKVQEKIRISVDKQHSISADINLRLQLDFFNLLKISLLSFDLNYEYAQSKKTHYSFFEKDIFEFQNNSSNKYLALKNIIKNKEQATNELIENIIQNDERMTQNLSSTYSVLLFGSIKKTATEQIKVVKDNEFRYFYKNYSSSIKLIQNFWSKVFGLIIHKLFDFESPTKTAAQSTKKMQIEYEKSSELDNILENEEQFSLQLTQNFSAANTHKWYHKKYLDESIRHLTRFTNINSNVISMLRDKDLKAPLEVNSNLRVEAVGLRYFHQLTQNEVFGKLADICNASNKKDWMDSRKRKKLLRRFSYGSNNCVKKIGNRYLSYINTYNSQQLINLDAFKKFLGSYFKNSRGYIDLIHLFGEENVFIHGDFSATTKDGQPFQNYFKSGQFRGLGVIDSFMRQGATVVPVPIRN